MLARRGEITPPWGVPVTVSETTPSTSTPARSHCRNSLSTRRSDTRRPTSEQPLVVDLAEEVRDVGFEDEIACPR